MSNRNPHFLQTPIGARVGEPNISVVAIEVEKESFARALFRLRKARRWSQRKLAAVANIEAQTISNAETGSRFPRDETYEKIAAALGMTVQQLDAEWKDKVVVELPRAAYEEIAERAKQKGMTVEAWIARAAGHHRTQVVTRTPQPPGRGAARNTPASAPG